MGKAEFVCFLLDGVGTGVHTSARSVQEHVLVLILKESQTSFGRIM